MINLIQNLSTSKPIENYSLMVIGSEHMMVGDNVSGGDDEEALKISLFGVETRINLPPKRRSWSQRCSVSRYVVSF
jgi:hypothetical protein